MNRNEDYHAAGDGIVLQNGRPEEDLQGFPGTAAEISKKLAIIKKVMPENFGNAKDEMSVGNLLEDVHAQQLPKPHHALCQGKL